MNGRNVERTKAGSGNQADEISFCIMLGGGQGPLLIIQMVGWALGEECGTRQSRFVSGYLFAYYFRGMKTRRLDYLQER